jgi:hypothetical protein
MKRLFANGLKLDAFLHDGEHTYRRMRAEHDLAWSALRPGGLLLNGDAPLNSAFEEFVQKVASQDPAVVPFAPLSILRKHEVR